MGGLLSLFSFFLVKALAKYRAGRIATEIVRILFKL